VTGDRSAARLSPGQAALMALALTLLPSAAGAETWQVRRDRGEALRQQAVRTLLATPEDAALARRLTGRLKAVERQHLLATLAERAARAGAGADGYAAHMAHAQVLLALGRSAEAATSFERATTCAPRPAAWRGQGRALAAAQQPAAALAAFERGAAAPGAPAALIAEAAELARTVSPAREVALRRRLVQVTPSSAALLALARAMSRVGDEAAAAALLEDRARGRAGAQAIPGASVAERLALLREAARLHEAAAQDEAAERSLLLALDLIEPAAAAALEVTRQLAALALRTGRGESTARLLTGRLQRATPAARRNWGPALAELLEALGELEQALATWRQLGDSARAEAAVLTLLERLDRQDELAPRFDRLARSGGRAIDLLLPLVERAYERADLMRARDRFDRLLRAGRRSRPTLLRLADVASRFEDHDRVLASWDALRALDPRDEQAVLGLGEAHFQRGRRELAHRTWGTLLRIVRPPAAGQARLAEILADHDMLDEALAAALAARRLAPRAAEYHRTLAHILEKRREPTAAITAWRAALQASGGPDQESARREARGRILALLGREGRERLRAETVLLKDRARRHPEDRETALFLAELQLRLQEPSAAVETLTATAERNPADAEVVLMLVRLLRQARQSEKALTWLGRLAAELPARAPEALLQVAGLRLDRYEDEAAFTAARQAVALAPGSSEVALRAAEMAERAGRTDEAREFLASAARAAPANTRVSLAASRLEVRQGQRQRAREILQRALATGDPAARADLLIEHVRLADTGSEATALLVRAAGDRGDLDEAVASEQERGLIVQQARRNQRRVEAGTRSSAADQDERRLVSRAVREIGQQIDEGQRPPDLADVELLGKLGNRDALPRFLRLAQPGRHVGDPRLAVAAVIAMGRLADPRARPTLEALTAAPNPRLREAATWALGRLRDRRALGSLERASGDARAEVRAWALLGLGRLPEPPLTAIQRAALDTDGASEQRRAALVALAMLARPGAPAEQVRSAGLGPALIALAAASDRGVASCAALALAAIGGGETVRPLWRAALLGDGFARQQAYRVLRSSSEDTAGRALDEARYMEGSELRVGQVLDQLCDGAAPTGPLDERALVELWVEHIQEIASLLAEASAGTERWRALEAVVAMPRIPEAARHELLQALERALGRGLADPDWVVRRAAVHAAARLGDSRLGIAHVAALLGDLPAGHTTEDRRRAEAAAAAALGTLRAQDRLDTDALAAGLGPLLDRPDWRTRLAAVRTLALGRALVPSLRRRAAADPNPFVAAAAAQGSDGGVQSASDVSSP
jgi:lipopolysaccharide biosynthesis regulator YciM